MKSNDINSNLSKEYLTELMSFIKDWLTDGDSSSQST